MSTARRRLLAVAGGVFLAALLLVLAEAAVRVAGIEPPPWPSADRLAGFEGVAVDPLLGPLPRPGYAGEWFGGFNVEIDEHGFRGTGLPPPDGAARRVAVLGDSCSFGWGIDTPETFVARLDARQRAGGAPVLELLNAAYPGQSAVVGEHMLREKVLPLHPDVVVLGFGANNAFRFSLVEDAERFQHVGLRRWLLRSRLLHILLARLAERAVTGVHPRERQAVLATPFSALRRVASPGRFAESTRRMVADARAAGAVVVFLVLPRAGEVSTSFRTDEDAALGPPLPAHTTGERLSPRELTLFEATCLDHRTLADPPAALRDGMARWQPVYPNDPALRAALRDGAQAFVRGDLGEATRLFAAAVAQHPDSPLALYDLGVARLSAGDAGGLESMQAADQLACNVFLHYQVILWEIAAAEHVPVADITLWFQAHDGEPLFLDPAHPTPAGHAIIAEALWPLVSAAQVPAAHSALPGPACG
ncbi:MAG TPA: GDSL-type esterase/lipase family protein [Candidatus Dormibacteraeota bacterium]|nr:GDSL-type esterase/lipase family protein [Candidatus Dormibacteraeota bacterium]